VADVSTHLMFRDGSAREAVERYVELIPNSAITEVTGPDGPGQTIRFTLANRPFIAFDSPVAHGFGFTPSMSIFVTCDTPEEVGELFGAGPSECTTSTNVGGATPASEGQLVPVSRRQMPTSMSTVKPRLTTASGCRLPVTARTPSRQ
jgi:predicted 3-demethylubiquinone-9 3-methyltransferase (glyoxalase superfamily)